MKTQQIIILLTSIAIIAILSGYALKKFKSEIVGMQSIHPIDEIPPLLIEKLLIRHLLGSCDAEIEVTVAPHENPEEDPYHFPAEGDIFTWKSVGILPNGDHIVYAYYWPEGAMGKFSGLYVVRYANDTLSLIAEIAQGERHSSGVTENGWKLADNVLTYCQHMSSHGFFDYMLDKYPNLFELAESKSREGLCYGEAGYLGYGEFQVTINPDGTLQDRRLISFSAGIAGLEQEEQQPAFGSLSIVDAMLYVFVKCNAKAGGSELCRVEEKDLSPLIKEVLNYTKREGSSSETDS